MEHLIKDMAEWNGALAGLNQTGLFFACCLFMMLCVFMSGFCLLLYLRCGNRIKELRKKLDFLEEKLQARECSLENADNRFNNLLDIEELKSRFNKIAVNTIEVPDKYRHLASLERSGLSVKEIAEILDVSQHEAMQMLSLARLSGGCNEFI